MKNLLPLAASTLLATGGGLETDYAAARSLFVTARTSLELETTLFEMERDGEPVETGFDGGSTSLEERSVEHVDVVLAHADGRPTKVRRAFGTVERETTVEMGGQSFEGGGDGPLAGVTLELALEDGLVGVEVVDGKSPDPSSALEGHGLALALDGLLPEGAVAEGESWELDGAAIARALSLDLEDALFPPPARDEEPSEGGRRRRGTGGPRPSALRPLAAAEWEGRATLGPDVEHAGLACASIGLSFEAEGRLPDAPFGGGPRGRAFGLSAAAPAEGTLTARLEGTLLFAKEARHPVLLDVEGTVTTARRDERERQGTVLVIRVEQSGSFEHRVEIEAEGRED